MKLAAVSQRADRIESRNETRDGVDRRLFAFLLAAGAIGVGAPNGYDEAALAEWLERVKPDIVVLSGGNDVGGCIERDRTETQLIRYATIHRLPLLGICRGMQMIAADAGAALAPVDGHIRMRHLLRGEIAQEVNSFHAFGIASAPKDWRILAVSEDGAIEAIAHNALPQEGWMWHPERETPFNPSDIARSARLFGA